MAGARLPALTLHPVASHFFRFWLWLTTGMITREWIAIHRKHHARCETDEDPHSPQIYGIWRVLFGGVGLYQTEAGNQETLEIYAFMEAADVSKKNGGIPVELKSVLKDAHEEAVKKLASLGVTLGGRAASN